MRNRVRAILSLAGIFAALTVATISLHTSVTDIAQPFPVVHGPAPADSLRLLKPLLTIGVVSRYPPPVIYHGYQPIMDYLTERTAYRFELRTASSYQDAVDQLNRGDVAAAFLGTYIYIRAHQQYGVQAILKPLNENGEPVSRSVLITRTDSPIREVKDLRGKRVALPSQDSFSGNWLPLAEFPRAGFAGGDLPSVRHFAHHQSVIYQVLKGSFDAGVVKERVAREYGDRNIRIVSSSAPIPGSPLVTARDCDTAVIRSLQRALLAIDVRTPGDRERVRQWDPEFRYGFAVATDGDYDGVRALLRAQNGKNE